MITKLHQFSQQSIPKWERMHENEMNLWLMMSCQVLIMLIDIYAGEQKARLLLKIIIPAVSMVVLFVFFANHIRRIKALRRYKAILEENCK